MFYMLVGSIAGSSFFYINNSFANDVGFTPKEQSYVFSSVYLMSTASLLFLAEHKSILTKSRAFFFLPTVIVASYLPGIWASL